MVKNLVKSGFQLDHVCVTAEPFPNQQEGSGIDLDYITIQLWSETLDFSFPTLPEVA